MNVSAFLSCENRVANRALLERLIGDVSSFFRYNDCKDVCVFDISLYKNITDDFEKQLEEKGFYPVRIGDKVYIHFNPHHLKSYLLKNRLITIKDIEKAVLEGMKK